MKNPIEGWRQASSERKMDFLFGGMIGFGLGMAFANLMLALALRTPT